MNRKDWIWVVVKAFGIYLGIQALLALPPLICTYLVINRASSGFRVHVGPEATIPLWQQAATFFILMNLSLYLLRSGRLVYVLIGRSLPPSLGETASTPPATPPAGPRPEGEPK
jgi:hypothetical protein